MTNQQIREWYLQENARIAQHDQELAAAGATWEQRARAAHAARHQARLAARAMMPDPSEVEALRRRDQEVHGNPDGPTFELLRERHLRAGATLEEAYRRIVESAPRSNPEVDRRFTKPPT